jgi:hypothetical protein
MGQTKVASNATSAILPVETPAKGLSSASGFGTFRSRNQSQFQTLTNGLSVALH